MIFPKIVPHISCDILKPLYTPLPDHPQQIYFKIVNQRPLLGGLPIHSNDKYGKTPAYIGCTTLENVCLAAKMCTTGTECTDNYKH